MLPVHLSISGTCNFRKRQVQIIDTCHQRQAKKSLVNQNLSIWIVLLSVFHLQSCSLCSSRIIVNKSKMCNLCSVHDKGSKCDLLYSSVFLCQSNLNKFTFSVHNMNRFLMHIQCGKQKLKKYVWLHSSVGRASHRYRGGHRFESHWSPDFLQASHFQLLKLENLLWWSLFTSYTTAVQIWIISYILHITSLHGKIWTQ